MENTKIIQFNPFLSNNSYLKLSESVLSDIIIEGAEFNSCLFFLGSWKKLVFRNCKFFACTFDSLDLSACIFENCSFSYCRLDSCKWVSCNFSKSSWKKSNVVHGQWVLCNLDDATTEFVDDYSDDHEETQNTATWTLNRKMTFAS